MKTLHKLLFLIIFFSAYISLGATEHRIIVRTTFNRADRSISFSYEKQVFGSYTFRLEFMNLDNAYDPFCHEVLYYGMGDLFTLKPIDPSRPIRFSSYSCYFFLGRTNPVADTTFVYLLPFRNGLQVKVHTLSYLWKKLLDKVPPKNWKSFLFRSDKADTIYAVRKGIVIRVETENAPDSLYTRYHTQSNTILVEHADGTIASYNGLAQNGSFVKEGDVVYPQTPLGFLGYYDAQKDYQLRFSIFHLIEDTPPTPRPHTMQSLKSYHEYINPYFLTEKGVTRLTKNQTYITTVNDKALTAEMTKKEVKKLHTQTIALLKK